MAVKMCGECRSICTPTQHIIDWFPITMRLTVLQQQTKTLQMEQPKPRGVSKQIDSVKHLLWHGNVDEALERLGNFPWTWI